MAKSPRVPGESEQTTDDPAAPPEQAGDGDDPGVADFEADERVQQLLEVVERLSDRVGDLEAVVEGLAKRIGQGNSQAVAATEPVTALTQDEALAKANELGRAVLSRDGWVAPTKVAPPPTMFQVPGVR